MLLTSKVQMQMQMQADRIAHVHQGHGASWLGVERDPLDTSKK